jgi:uncharacterized phage protein (TIGR01671 family)
MKTEICAKSTHENCVDMKSVDMKKIGIYKIDIKRRERLFRLWDRFQKIMMGVEYNQENIGLLPHCDSTGASMYYSNGNITLINISSASYDIMEFIGAYDKNKKHIYEFDIVKWKEQLNDRFEHVKRNDEILGLVLWSEDECGFVVEQLTEGRLEDDMGHNTFVYDTNFYSTDGQEFLWEDLEVVGNMFQNPDMLLNIEEEKGKAK